MKPNAATSHPAAPAVPFRLLRWFSIASFVVVAVIAVANAWLLSNFLSQHMVQREAEMTRDFVQNVIVAEGSTRYLAQPGDAELARRFEESTQHLTGMTDVLRTNVYASDRKLLWSSTPGLAVRSSDENEELDEAIGGELVVHWGRIADGADRKPEHQGLDPRGPLFVETYIPIADPATRKTLGVVEVYRAPVALTTAIRQGHLQVWATAIGGGLLLYLTLFWIVRRADSMIRAQHARLVDAETTAVVGDLASAVAHNIRNPLAAIRSSAELTLALGGDAEGERARDIVAETDRIGAWIHELLRFARQDAGPAERVDAGALVADCADDFGREFERRGVAVVVAADRGRTYVNANTAALRHALSTLVENALDATPSGGTVTLRTVTGGPTVRIDVADTGCGIAPDDMDKLFRPFHTTKARGTGLGLSLAKRVVERMGGRIAIQSKQRLGTTVSLVFPGA